MNTKLTIHDIKPGRWYTSKNNTGPARQVIYISYTKTHIQYKPENATPRRNKITKPTKEFLKWCGGYARVDHNGNLISRYNRR